MAPGERALIIGENEDGDWYNILLEDGTEGWIADFLVNVLLITHDGIEMTPTPESADAKLFVRPLVKRGETQISQEATEEPDAPEATEEDADSKEKEQALVAPAAEDDGYKDARWYSMTIGIVVSILVITIGNIFNVLRVIVRRSEEE